MESLKTQLDSSYWNKGTDKVSAWDIPAELMRNLHDSKDCEEAIKVEDILREMKKTSSIKELASHSNDFLKKFGYVWDPQRNAYRIEFVNEKKVVVVCHNGFGLARIAHLLQTSCELVWNHFYLPHHQYQLYCSSSDLQTTQGQD